MPERPAASPRYALAILLMGIALHAALARADEEASIMASDGWYDVSSIDVDTYAIHEPGHWQKNVMYVIKGEKRSILLDTGSGSRDLAFMAGKVTKVPMTAVASDLHYSHIGSHGSFHQVAMIDLPETRAATSDNWYSPPWMTSLSIAARGFHVTEWWKPGEVLDLGNRRLEVVALPGHSSNGIALVDRERGCAFVGDFLYEGTLLANLPGSDTAAYLQSVQKLLADYPEIRHVYGAHEGAAMTRESLVQLETALAAIVQKKAGGQRLWWFGYMAARYPGGDRFTIVAAP